MSQICPSGQRLSPAKRQQESVAEADLQGAE